MTAKPAVFRSSLVILFLAAALSSWSVLCAETLTDARISEFLADNGKGLRDQDGDREDWIEIRNSSGVTGDLEGWHLTDDPANLTKWTFPAVEMTSGDYLVVFASGKDRREVTGELHTNFRLQRQAGGYLALVKPDGVTVASVYANYPEQLADVAYGQRLQGATPVTLIPEGAQARWLVPTGTVADWTETSFDDRSWKTGATGIGYDGPGGDYLPLIGAGGDTRSEMWGKNATAYIRIPFEVTNPATLSNLTLRLKWEDGFVAHLNGTEFHRESAPANPAWDSSSGVNRNEDEAKAYFSYPVDEGSLVPGTNILAIQGLNNAAGSADFLIVPELVGTSQDPDNFVTGFFVDPTPGEENTLRYDGIVGDTRFSVDRGIHQSPFDLEITTLTEGASIRYTTDGSLPSENSGLLYSGPIPISGTTVIRALAYKEGYQSTNVDTQTYLFPEDIYGSDFTEALTSVPIISVVTQANYDLRLMSVSSTSQLPSQFVEPPAKSQVIVARVNDQLHVRVIDVHVRRNQETNRFEYQTVIDKSESQLVNGEAKAALQALVNQAPLPDASTMSPEKQREIIEQAITASAHTPQIPFLQDGNNDYIEHKSSVEMIYPDGSPGFQEDAGLSNFGGGFTNFAKKSFRLNFRKEYGAARLEHPIFDGFEYPNFPPANDFDAIDLRSGSHDMTNRGAYMSARFVDDSMIEMGQPAPHGRFVHVYLNGRFWGQYHLRERWSGDMGASYYGGEKEDYDAIAANNSGQQFLTGVVYDGTAAFWNETRSLLAGPDPFTNAAGHIDIPNVIDFMLLWTSGECESEFRSFGSRSQGVPFKFMIRDPDGFMPGGSWSHVHAVTHSGPLNAMTELRTGGNSDYQILLADRIHKHFFNGGAMTAEKSIARLRRRFEEMRPGFSAEARRWNYQTVASWESYVNSWLNSRLTLRSTSMMQRLRQAGMYPDLLAPDLSQHGGSLPVGSGITMNTNATAIYYTLDGSDPRLSGGGINPSALSARFSDGVREPEDFIVSGAVWKYLDDGSDQGSAWNETSYDDSSWASGPSQLGYGETDLSTTVGFIDVDPVAGGTQKNATTYFRKTVTIDSPSDFSNFVVRLRYDDGAAVYVNGTEIARTSTLPPGAAYDTYATGNTPSEGTYFDYEVPSSRFVDGENTIAVEIHNVSAGSSDIRFDLILSGEVDLTNGSNITEPIVLTGPTIFQARAFNSSTNEWSPLTSTFFSIDTVPADSSNLVISEIHYRPADPGTPEEVAVSTDRDDFEFIELLNPSASPVDLTGVYFDDGISFFFPENTILEAGERFVLVKNLAAFTARYGELTEGTIVGEYGGRLSNDGETLIVRKTGAIEIINLTYNDQAPWPVLADGSGYSMIFTGNQSNEGSSWSTHAEIGGAPGAPDTALVDGYDLWKIANGIDNDHSDSDEDGLTAFVEYATGNNPGVPDASPVSSRGIVAIDPEGYLSITYQQGLEATDVFFEIQKSNDLETWTTVMNTILIDAVDDPVKPTRQITLRLAEPVSRAARHFLRVRMVR